MIEHKADSSIPQGSAVEALKDQLFPNLTNIFNSLLRPTVAMEKPTVPEPADAVFGNIIDTSFNQFNLSFPSLEKLIELAKIPKLTIPAPNSASANGSNTQSPLGGEPINPFFDRKIENNRPFDFTPLPTIPALRFEAKLPSNKSMRSDQYNAAQNHLLVEKILDKLPKSIDSGAKAKPNIPE